MLLPKRHDMIHKSYKTYYDKPYLSQIESKIIDIKGNGIILDRTVAYPEGGGQEGDKGVLIVDNREIPFYDTKKGLGRTIYLDDFPTISVDTPILHYVNEEDLKHFKMGDSVVVKIDTIRRAKLSISHSATHIMLMAMETKYPGIEKTIYGTSIKEDSARLDFRTPLKFSSEDIKEVEKIANEIVAKNEEIKVFRHPKEPEALYWQLDWYITPCGGTHIDNTKYIKSITLKRKNLGKKGQRVSLTFEHNSLYQEKFYE